MKPLFIVLGVVASLAFTASLESTASAQSIGCDCVASQRQFCQPTCRRFGSRILGVAPIRNFLRRRSSCCLNRVVTCSENGLVCGKDNQTICIRCDAQGNPSYIGTWDGYHHFRSACYTNTDGPMGPSCAVGLLFRSVPKPAYDQLGNPIPWSSYPCGASLSGGTCVCN